MHSENRKRSPLKALILAFAVCVLAVASAGLGSVLPARAEQLSFRSYSQADGLTDLDALCLKQAASGYMLVCTEHGVYIYDGRRFFNLGPEQGLPEGGIVQDLAVIPGQRLILRYRTRIYVSRQSLTAGSSPELLRFVLAKSAHDFLDNDSYHQSRSILWRSGVVLVANGRLLYVDPGSDHEPATISDMAQVWSRPYRTGWFRGPLAAGGGLLWATTADGTICDVTRPVFRCLGAAAGLPAARWEAMLVGQNGHVFARSEDLLADIDPVSGRASVEVLPDQSAGYSDYFAGLSLAQSPKGELITQAKDGLIIRDPSGWRAFGKENGLPAGAINTIMFDAENDLWLAISGSGVARTVGYGVWENWARADGLSNDAIWQLARQPGGPLLIASDSGLDTLDSAQTGARIRQRDLGSAYSVLASRSGHVWRSEGVTGVACIDLETHARTHFDLPPVNQILQAADNGVWFITENGLFYTDDTGRTPPAPVRVGAISGSIAAATFAADASLYFIQRGHLLHRHSDGTVRDLMIQWPDADFVPENIAIAGDATVWAGGSGGKLYRLQVANDHVVKMDSFGPPSILSNTIVSLVIDRRGWLWVGTDGGISVYDGSRWVSTTIDTGLVWNDLNQGSLLADPDGSIWIGTTGGLSHLLHPEELFKRPPLKPVISAVLAGDALYQSRALDYTRQPLLIRFGALNFRSAGVVRFRYRLDDVDSGWAETPTGYARYPSVPPGRHRFSLVAYDPLTQQSSAPVEILIRMRQPWWLWWPVIVLYVALAAAIIYAGLRLRYRLLLEQRNALQRAVELQTMAIREAQSRDSLTNLLNRGEVQSRVVALLEQNRPAELTIALLDVDYFKRINDQFGHLAGDEILKELGRRIGDALEADEYAGRYGGEEVLIVSQRGGAAGIERMTAFKQATCRKPYLIEDEVIRVTCSIGVAQIRSLDDWKSLIGRADKALYEAKASGRDRIVAAPADPQALKKPLARVVPAQRH